MSKKILLVLCILAFVGYSFSDIRSMSLNDIFMANCVAVRMSENNIVMDFISENTKESEDGIMSFEIVRAEGDSFSQCINKAREKTGEQINLGHLRSIFLEESFFNERQNYSDLLDMIKRERFISNYVSFYILSDPDDELTKHIKEKNPQISAFVSNVVIKYPSSETLVMKYKDVAGESSEYCLPCIAVADEIKLDGIYSLKNGRLVSKYTGIDEAMFKLLSKKVNQLYISTDACAFLVNKHSVKLVREGELKFAYELQLWCEMKELWGESVSVYDGDEEDMEQKIEKELSGYMKRFISEMQKDNVDAAGICDFLKKHYYKDYLVLNASHTDLFKDCEVGARIKVHIIKNELNK